MIKVAKDGLPAKPEYKAPVLSVIGSFEDITKATNIGSAIDGVYPIHTPVAGHTS